MRSIRVQFLAFIVTLLLILLILLNLFPLISARDQIMDEKKVSLSNQAAVISSSLGALELLSQDSVREVLSFLDMGGISRIIVVNSQGVSVYDSFGPVGVNVEISQLQTALESKTVFNSAFRDGAFSSIATCPIYNQNIIIGAVGVYEKDQERADTILDIQKRISAISLSIGFVALAIVIAFSEILIRRISNLVSSIKIVAAGDYRHRLSIRGHDEIAELGGEFNILTERLDDTEKQRRRFVSDASHELKTPLASIRLLADSIVQTENMAPDMVREFVADIGNEAERLQHTTEKLLDLSRLDDDIQTIPEPVDVKQIIMDSCALLKPLADEKDVEIRQALEDGCVIMANSDDIFHAIFNLIENGIKYNIDKGWVSVSCVSDDSHVRINVEDCGIGIPEADRINIFSRFYRVDKARSREAGGSGLGLSIVHDAVHAHGGTISVGANKPRGSVFIVEFPKPSSEETGI